MRWLKAEALGFVTGLLVAGGVAPAMAGQANLVCKGKNGTTGFVINLKSQNGPASDLSELGIAENSTVTVGPLDEGTGPVTLELDPSRIDRKASGNGKISLQFYREHTTPFPRRVSIIVKLDAKSTGKRNAASGYNIYRGTWGIEVRMGSRNDDELIDLGHLFSRASGKVVCK